MGTEVKVNSEKRLNIFSEDSRNGEMTKNKGFKRGLVAEVGKSIG